MYKPGKKTLRIEGAVQQRSRIAKMYKLHDDNVIQEGLLVLRLGPENVSGDNTSIEQKTRQACSMLQYTRGKL